MRSGKTASVEDLQIVSRLEGLRQVLLAEAYAEHLDKPLAYWALPTDRRLPLAFLGRRLRDLLSAPFADLAATPGIGRKKMTSFVNLLARAANTDAADLPTVGPEAVQASLAANTAADNDDGFDPDSVSEVTWAQWRTTVVQHGLTHETLGHLAPSLRNMTRVIWNRRLGDYVHLTLAEIHAMKTHGEKRVHTILEVFHAVHTLVAKLGAQDHLVVRLSPRRIDAVEHWVGHALQRADVPSEQEIFTHYIQPLLAQIRTDATQQIASLAENRLGLAGPITSVRQAARTIGLTRARVYQLLNEINDIMMARWPMGRYQSHELRERLLAEIAARNATVNLEQFTAAVELFYPGSRRGADGAIETARPREAAPDAELAAVS